MSHPTTQLELLEAVMAWEPKAYIFGGFAEDALLYGRESRPHEDIDLFVLREDLDLRVEQARQLGFEEWHIRIQAVAQRPLVIGSVRDGLNLEIIVFDRAPNGRIYWELPTAEGLSRLYMPDELFAAEPSSVEGVEVRTFTPLALYQIRAGVVGLFDGMRRKDIVSQAALVNKFFRDVPEEQLQPEIEPIVGAANPILAAN